MEMSEGMRSSEVEESIFHPRKDGGGIMMILLFLESARTMARDGERGERRERERKKLIARGIIRGSLAEWKVFLPRNCCAGHYPRVNNHEWRSKIRAGNFTIPRYL